MKQTDSKKPAAGMFRRMQTLAALGISAALMASALLVPVQAADEVSMYRLYNPNSGEHFYTASANEKDTLASIGWSYEAVGWVAPGQGDPVYRLYNSNAGDHHYTTSENERKTLTALGWKDEGTGWMSDPHKTVAVFRQYNPNAKAGAHNYTTDRTEADALVRLGWKDEAVGWYALRPGTPAAPAVSSGLTPLHVQGTQLVNAQNQPVVLQGFSTFGLNYMPEFVDEGVFRFLKDQMHSDVIRLALYTQESGGYCSGGDQQKLKDIIDRGVSAAEKTGQYVIIDWHILSDGNPNQHLEEARAFFNELSARYAGRTNVLYEICNEPNGCDWNQIKAYARQIIPVIRAHDPDAVILVGTPTWSQDVDTAAQSPLSEFSNIMYSLHFYAASHKDSLRQKLSTAHQMGLPVFVSEFGISSADGNGSLDPTSGNAWIALLNQYGISRVGWAISNKNEASALLQPGSQPPLSLQSLSEGGRWFRQTYTAQNPGAVPPSPTAQPSTPVQSGGSTAGSALSASLRRTNSWQDGSGKTMSQYALTLSSTAPVQDWTAVLQFSKEAALSQSWNVSVTQQGRTFILRPVDYNRTISPSAPVEIGLIVAETPGQPAPNVQVR